ncbi:hypothetical protein J5Y03_09855 [Bacillus sp. RG28]|uniref:Uncharacterized protein n=1 Tax=Gottfriedia endophytica TaxID=2820819 RepID=A0A940SKQ1_9BACI|nr:hypothetical protein [Gottfriedia endophytica]MBP0725493.1 hypothetical protein [Gottfriedia endophytica]
MDNVINCARCYSLTVQNGKSKLCQKCTKIDNAWLEVVLNYLRKRENRMATIVQVLNATAVNEDWIYEWVRQGKILQRHFPNMGIPCPKCGENLTDGVSLCISCKGIMVRDLNEVKIGEDKSVNHASAFLVKNHNNE